MGSPIHLQEGPRAEALTHRQDFPGRNIWKKKYLPGVNNYHPCMIYPLVSLPSHSKITIVPEKYHQHGGYSNQRFVGLQHFTEPVIFAGWLPAILNTAAKRQQNGAQCASIRRQHTHPQKTGCDYINKHLRNKNTDENKRNTFVDWGERTVQSWWWSSFKDYIVQSAVKNGDASFFNDIRSSTGYSTGYNQIEVRKKRPSIWMTDIETAFMSRSPALSMME